MIVYVVLEHRFDRTPDGEIWTLTQFPYSFWVRYLDVFEDVVIVARVNEVESVDANALKVNGPNVSCAPLPHYLGPKQFIFKAIKIRTMLNEVAGSKAALIMRVPSTLSACISNRILFKRPYGLEVVADPWDIFAPGAIRHPLRFIFRRFFTWSLKSQIRHSEGAAYVTQRTLQQRYATDKMYWYSDAEIGSVAKNFHYSSIELSSSTVGSPRNPRVLKKIITVASLSTHYKGVDVLIDAISILSKRGINLELVIVGDGKIKPQLEKQVSDLCIGHLVKFIGSIPSGKPVFDALDTSDLFVISSRTEGLPRALIEAMARGLPCIGTSVGGIPELLEPENMVLPGNALALAEKIADIKDNFLMLESMSIKNLEKARSFEADAVSARRTEFYKFIKKSTQLWIEKNSLIRKT